MKMIFVEFGWIRPLQSHEKVLVVPLESIHKVVSKPDASQLCSLLDLTDAIRTLRNVTAFVVKIVTPTGAPSRLGLLPEQNVDRAIATVNITLFKKCFPQLYVKQKAALFKLHGLIDGGTCDE